MTLVVALCVFIIFAVGVYMLLGNELKGIAMGVFLIAHAAHLSILAMSGSPILFTEEGQRQVKQPPVVQPDQVPEDRPLLTTADPLPQALILTAIVIGFGVMGFLLTLIVVTGRTARTLDVDQLTEEAEQAGAQPPETYGPDRTAP